LRRWVYDWQREHTGRLAVLGIAANPDILTMPAYFSSGPREGEIRIYGEFGKEYDLMALAALLEIDIISWDKKYLEYPNASHQVILRVEDGLQFGPMTAGKIWEHVQKDSSIGKVVHVLYRGNHWDAFLGAPPVIIPTEIRAILESPRAAGAALPHPSALGRQSRPAAPSKEFAIIL